MRVPHPSLVLLLLAADIVAVGALAVLVLVSSVERPEPVRSAAAAEVAGSRAGLDGGAPPDGDRPLLFVVTGDGPVDAVAAGAAAGALRSQVLPVTTGSLSPAIRRALARLAPERVVVVGGSDAVDDALSRQLQEITGSRVVRLAGDNRFDTAAQVATTFFRPPVQRVVVTTGPEPAAGSGSAGGDGPVLLVTPEGVPTETARALEVLRPREIVVLGGADDPSPTLLSALEAHAPGAVQSVAASRR